MTGAPGAGAVPPRVTVLGTRIRHGQSGKTDRCGGPRHNVISQYADLVVGRMGVPYRERGLSIIALLVDGSTDALGAMTGKLGNIPGVKVRSVLLTAAGQELSPKEDS